MTAVRDPSSAAAARAARAPRGDDARANAAAASPALGEVYREHFDLVWRSLRQLGVAEPALEDVAHDVFLIVQRRLGDFDPARGSMRAWLYGIARKVADRHRRGEARELAGWPVPGASSTPESDVARAQAVRLVQTFFDALDPDRREVFYMTEVEGMSAPEIAQALEIKLNTVYSRLRRARAQFGEFVRDHTGEQT